MIKLTNLFSKVFIALIILIVFSSIFLILNKRDNSKKTINYVLFGRQYRLLVANNQKEWEKGLMFHRHLDGVDGMIFLYPDKQYRSFWNKNTYLDLKLYWLIDDKVVGQDDLPSV